MGGLIRSKEELNERFFNTNRAALRDQVGANDDFGRSDLWRRHGKRAALPGIITPGPAGIKD